VPALDKSVDAPRQHLAVGQLHAVCQNVPDFLFSQLRAVQADNRVSLQDRADAVDDLVISCGRYIRTIRSVASLPAKQRVVVRGKVTG